MIEIKEVVIEGFKRFPLGYYQNLIYRPTTPYQIIIGPNGAGKTRFQRLLAPYLTPTADFQINGSMRKKFLCHGQELEERVEYNKTVSYQFIDDANLNEGGTRLVQGDLYTGYTGMNQDGYDVLTDRYKLTQMSPQKREEFLTRISGIDLDFVTSKYETSRKTLRQKKGAREEFNRELNKLLSEVMSEEDLTNLRRREQEYEQDLNDLQSARIIDVATEYVSRSDYDFTQAKSAMKSCLDSTMAKLIGVDFSCEQDFSSAKAKLSYKRERLSEVQADYEKALLSYDEIQSNRDFLEANSKLDVKDIELRHETYLKEFRSIAKELWSIKDFYPHTEACMEAMDDCSDELLDRITALPENTRLLNPETLEEARVFIEKQTEVISYHRRAVDTLEHQIKHLEAQDEVRCPDCHRRFKPNQDPDAVPRLKKELEELKSKLTHEEHRYKQAVEFSANATHYLAQWDSILNIFNQHYTLRMVYDHLRSLHPDFRSEPNGVIESFSILRKQLETLHKSHEIEQQIKEDEETLQILAKTGALEKEQLDRQLGILSKEIDIHNLNIDQLSTEIKTLETGIQVSEQARRDITDALNIHEEWCTKGENEIITLINEWVDVMVSDYKDHISKIRVTLSEQQSKLNQVNEYQRKIEDLDIDIRALETIVRELSPKVGLIAEQMVGFVTGFIDSMNDIIKRIWSSPFVILPAKSEGESLTYIFPVEVNDHVEDPATDVKEGIISDGQCAIVNFAFKICALLQMGLSGIPLLLDEVEREMHPEHKINLMNYVRELIEQKVFSQVFIISHHVSSYGALPNAEILDLSPENIAKGANTHVEFY